MMPGGFLLVLAIILPIIAILLIVALDERQAERIALAAMPAGLAIALAIVTLMIRTRHALRYHPGGWTPPLGLTLRVDGFGAAMLLTAALVIGATAIFARETFPPGRPRTVFWVLLLTVWSALNSVFVGGDLFNLYVALELLTFGAVPLVCLDGRDVTLAAALRYMLFALLGSVLYLLGTALLYGSYGTLDIALLAASVHPEPAALAAALLMTVGLLAKTALFPLYLWLPPAHAGAPPAASAVLSALVVKASFFLVLLLWFSALPGMLTLRAAQLLAGLGAAAILFGSAVALRQARLKLLVAYSTVAQIGYLFLLFPLAVNPEAAWTGEALEGGMVQAISHAFAKAAMFMAAGLIAETLGHDRVADLAGVGRVMPMTVAAFGLGGLSLMGVPPSGGFAAKWLLLKASVASGQWGWALVILTGGLFAGGYVFRVLAPAFAARTPQTAPHASVARSRQAVVLGLAVLSLVLGLAPLSSFALLQIGRADTAIMGAE
jgi:multicomponent Na+:H+ antiporter subunit D